MEAPGPLRRLANCWRALWSGAQAALDAPGVDFRALLEGSLDMICLVEVKNGEHRFVYASPACEEVIGWSAEELLRRSPLTTYTEESRRLIAEDVAGLAQGNVGRVVLEAIRKDGRHIWVENKVRVLERRKGRMLVVICTRDVTDRKLAEEQLSHLALVDGLTGLGNRRAFDDALEREWKRTVRTGDPLSLAMLDVDHFKRFNDTYGHLAGDRCLRAIATAVRGEAKRPGDVVARYGGEEIAVLLPETDAAGAERLANRMCRAVAELRVPHSGNPEGAEVVTISGGVSTAMAGAESMMRMPDGLVFAADSALYRAKSEGRNRVVTVVLTQAAE